MVSLRARDGRVWEADYRELAAHLAYGDGRLTIEGLSASGPDGYYTGLGKIELDGPPVLQLSFHGEEVPLSSIAR